MIASDRATALCTSCDLDPKSLFVLPHVDHLHGYAIRLENAFYDLAQSFYHGEARNIKSHKEHLNKSTHQYLLVRHQFKMGFLNELRQDNHTAHKHYTHAYTNLLEIRIVDTNANEIRTVAGFINYKLCRLMFALNLPRDAISQFRSHVDRFKNRIGFRELSFEHYAWLSKQYSMFGDIFDEAVKQGLPAVQTQHPGLYYQQAAQYTIMRRKLCEELCSQISTYPSPDPLEGSPNLEFFGQRPWRPGKLSAEPPDPHLENNGILALQYVEKQVNHSNIIITLYGLAITQYKAYRCPRTRRHLVVQMAEEYFDSNDYGKALTLFTHMLWDYRGERWWTIITSILVKALNCAFLTANIQDYISLSLEVLSNYVELPGEYKRKTYENLLRVLNRQLPDTDPDLPAEHIEKSTLLWKQLFAAKPLHPLQLEMGTVVCCLDVKCRFLKPEYEADETMRVEIYIKSLCLFPITVGKIMVFVNSPALSNEYSVDTSGAPIILAANEIKKYAVEFLPDPDDIDQDVQICHVNVHLGSPANCLVDLKFAGTGNDAQHVYPELQHFSMSSPPNMPDFDNVKPLMSAKITPRHSKIDLRFEHQNPSLLGEWYCVTATIVNNEAYDIRNITLEFTLENDEGFDSTEFSITDKFELEKLPLRVKLEGLGKLQEGSVRFYMRSHKIGERTVNCKVSFLLASEKPIASVKESSFQLSIVKPFEISTKYLSTLFENISKFYVDEEFVPMLVVNCLSPWPITIEDTSLEFYAPFENVDVTVESQIKGLQFKPKECGTEIYIAKPKRQSDKHADLGMYTVKWRRLNGILTTSEMILTGLPIEWIPLDMKLSLPEHGFVRTPLLVQYRFINKSHQLLQLDLSIEGSEGFMYAGYKQFQINILPEGERIVEYNLYPLIAGSVPLPRLILNIPENSTEGPALRQDQLNLLIERAVPKDLYVMPQVKGTPPSLSDTPSHKIPVQ